MARAFDCAEDNLPCGKVALKDKAIAEINKRAQLGCGSRRTVRFCFYNYRLRERSTNRENISSLPCSLCKYSCTI
jgi:hypothetical protein